MTTTYTVTRDQIIASALRKLGVLELGATPDTDTITNSALTLNLMIKQWMIGGIKLWTITEYELPLVQDTTTYTIGPVGCDLTADKPLRVIQAWLRNTSVTPNIDIPLQILSRQEYNVLGSKFSTGVTNSIFFDPGVTSSTVRVYLTPDSTSSSNYMLYMVVQKPIADILLADSVPDFPSEWMNALVWGLADQLALEYGLPVNHRQEIALKAEAYKASVEGWDIEQPGTYFTPNLVGGRF